MFYYIWQIIYDFFSTTSCDKFSLERYELIGRVTRTSNTTLNANVEYKRKSLTQGFLKLQKFLKTHILRKKGGRVVYCCWSWNYTLEQMEKNVTIFVDAYFTGVPFLTKLELLYVKSSDELTSLWRHELKTIYFDSIDNASCQIHNLLQNRTPMSCGCGATGIYKKDQRKGYIIRKMNKLNFR